MLSKLLHLNKLKNSRILAILYKETKLAQNIILSIKKYMLFPTKFNPIYRIRVVNQVQGIKL